MEKQEFFIPLTSTIDEEGERQRITKELEYAKGFLNSVDKKLGNDRFVSSAPDNVVAAERKKKEDAEDKIKLLEQQLQDL